jgi:hypothetical protein
VTVERQGIALLVGNTTADLEACPLCGSKLEGSKLDPECAEHASKRLIDGSISREPSALKRPPP